MKPSHLYSARTVCCLFLLAIVPSLGAQENLVLPHTGVSEDWSQRQIVFSRDALAQHPEILDREPRVRNQWMRRSQPSNRDAFANFDPLATHPKEHGIQRDWSVPSLGGRLRANTFPAKFTLDPNAPPDCVNDYVVFGLAIAGATGGQANLVAFNNLYVNDSGTGLCSGTSPNVLFAYNVSTAGGKILTSPVMSEDGTKIVFVESVTGAPTSAIFHVLTWSSGAGTIGNAAAPTSMTSLPFTSASDLYSSPWVDYSGDTAYVGDSLGNVYQITGVFTASPILSGDPWPVSLSTPYAVTSPVLDSHLGLLMVGSNNGNLYQINTTTGAVATLSVGNTGNTGAGIDEPPIVDVTNGTTFVVSSNVGSSAALVEVDTSSMNALSTADIGVGSAGGTNVHIYQPAFSNAYYNDPSTGVVSLCGTGTSTDTSPWQYEYGFTGRTMFERPETGFPVQLSTSTTDRCTGWTEFYNPNINSGVDFFFFGLTGDCTLYGTGFTGCVVALSSDPTILTASAQIDGGPSGIVVDNYNIAGSNIYFGSVSLDTLYQLSQDGFTP